MTIHAVVVSYRSEAVLPDMIAGLQEHEPQVHVIVVDNASPDGPPGVPDGVDLVVSAVNRGFGAGCNLGVATTSSKGAEFLAFLNPDVRLRASSLSELTGRMGTERDVGIAAAPLVDGSGVRIPVAWGPPSATRALWAATGWRLPRLRALAGRFLSRGASLSGATTSREELEVDGHVLGGAMVVRRECFEQLNGFDESFFMFWEDADLCLRARQAGWRVAVLPSTPIMHIEGTSSAGVTSEERWSWYVQGAERFAEKHLGPGQARRFRLALRVGRWLRRRGP